MLEAGAETMLSEEALEPWGGGGGGGTRKTGASTGGPFQGSAAAARRRTGQLTRQAFPLAGGEDP